jgi:hypothetical protein
LPPEDAALTVRGWESPTTTPAARWATVAAARLAQRHPNRTRSPR